MDGRSLVLVSQISDFRCVDIDGSSCVGCPAACGLCLGSWVLNLARFGVDTEEE